MTTTSTQRRMVRILAMVPWILANPYPMVSEVIQRFGYRNKSELAKDLSLLFVCGVPGYGPDDLIWACIDDDLVILEAADYFSQPLHLTPPEALGLLSAGMAVAGTSYGEPALTSAVRKLASVVFPDDRAVIGAELPTEPTHLADLQKATREHRAVRITYLSAGTNQTSDRVVEPLISYASMGHWYLSAQCRLAKDHRTFRIDRIRTLTLTAETFVPPPDADRPEIGFAPPADAIEADLDLGPGARWVAEYYPVEVIKDDGTEMRVRFTVSDPRVAARLLVRLGKRARLVKGREVNQELERLRSEILARYDES